MEVEVVRESRVSSHHDGDSSKRRLFMLLEVVMGRESARIKGNSKDLFGRGRGAKVTKT